MGVGLFLTGRYGRGGILSRPPAPAEWLPEVESWVRSHCADTLLSMSRGQDQQGEPALYLRLHPSADGLPRLPRRARRTRRWLRLRRAARRKGRAQPLFHRHQRRRQLRNWNPQNLAKIAKSSRVRPTNQKSTRARQAKRRSGNRRGQEFQASLKLPDNLRNDSWLSSRVPEL